MAYKMTQLMIKAIQLALATVVLVLGRFGAKAAIPDSISDYFSGPYYVPFGDPTSVDAIVFGDVVAYGFFWIILAQTISVLAGEDPYVLHLLFDLVGGVCYIAVGSMHIAYWADMDPTELEVGVFVATGSMALMCGFALLFSTIIYAGLLKEKNKAEARKNTYYNKT